jgi:hypothetical protein
LPNSGASASRTVTRRAVEAAGSVSRTGLGRSS